MYTMAPGSLEDKLGMSKYIVGRRVLDVGCNDGLLTAALAEEHPDKQFVGIDLNYTNIVEAEARNIRNAMFLDIDIHKVETGYDTIIFSSVLHEIYSYDRGHASVMRALARARELLNPDGRILVRDMMRPFDVTSVMGVMYYRNKIIDAGEVNLLEEFEHVYGPMNDIRKVNHYMLKALWSEHWAQEIKEDYLAVSAYWYTDMFRALYMKSVYGNVYLLPYCKQRWLRNYNLLPDDLHDLYSHGILVYERAK